MNVQTISRLFPYTNDIYLHKKLKINKELMTYITIPYQAEQINKIIRQHINSDSINITDATACIGGNSISFAYNFDKVISIELNKDTYDYLENNVKLFNFNNITLINGNCVNIVPSINNHDCIFIDPPWGGKNYKSQDNMRISLGVNSLEQICLNFLDPNIMVCVPKILVLKLPNNYDLYYFYKQLIKYNIYYYKLNRMIILVVENI
jgi:hypothetical protein